MDNLNKNPYIKNEEKSKESFNSKDFIKGALLGAAAMYLITNKDAQKNIVKGVSKISNLVLSAVEEIKERYLDLKAESQEE